MPYEFRGTEFSEHFEDTAEVRGVVIPYGKGHLLYATFSFDKEHLSLLNTMVKDVVRGSETRLLIKKAYEMAFAEINGSCQVVDVEGVCQIVLNSIKCFSDSTIVHLLTWYGFLNKERKK